MLDVRDSADYINIKMEKLAHSTRNLPPFTDLVIQWYSALTWEMVAYMILFLLKKLFGIDLIEFPMDILHFLQSC